MGADGDRKRMEAIARSLIAVESSEPASGQQVAHAMVAAAEFRRARGIPALVDDLEPPEEEFYRRARALGFRRIGR